MKSVKSLSTFLIFVVSLLSVQSYADSVGMNVGVFHGVALTYQKPLSDQVSVQLELTTAPYDGEFDQDGIEYDIEYDKNNIGALIQYAPYKYFYLAGGIYVGDHNWNLDAKPQGTSQKIGDRTYYSNNLHLKGQAAFSKASPYIGIGAQYTFANGITLRSDTGWLYIGKGALSYKATGKIYLSASDLEEDKNGLNVSDAQFQEDLEKERANLEEEIEDYNLLPMLHVGIAYTF